MSFNF